MIGRAGDLSGRGVKGEGGVLGFRLGVAGCKRQLGELWSPNGGYIAGCLARTGNNEHLIDGVEGQCAGTIGQEGRRGRHLLLNHPMPAHLLAFLSDDAAHQGGQTRRSFTAVERKGLLYRG